MFLAFSHDGILMRAFRWGDQATFNEKRSFGSLDRARRLFGRLAESIGPSAGDLPCSAETSLDPDMSCSPVTRHGSNGLCFHHEAFV